MTFIFTTICTLARSCRGWLRRGSWGSSSAWQHILALTSYLSILLLLSPSPPSSGGVGNKPTSRIKAWNGYCGWHKADGSRKPKGDFIITTGFSQSTSQVFQQGATLQTLCILRRQHKSWAGLRKIHPLPDAHFPFIFSSSGGTGVSFSHVGGILPAFLPPKPFPRQKWTSSSRVQGKNKRAQEGGGKKKISIDPQFLFDRHS